MRQVGIEHLNRLTACKLCPHRCGVNRLDGQVGYCRAGGDVALYRYGPHRGEEPPISGSGGSGTVFFSRCTLRCIYCQNYPWSQEGAGRHYTTEQLSSVFNELAAAGCHNLNLVSPTPWLPQVAEALDGTDSAGQQLPVVYNTSGYEREETLAWFGARVSVYLTDLRYSEPQSATEGSGRSDYVDVARAALQQMWAMRGALEVDENDVAVSGVICRILVLPGREAEAIDNLRWIADTLGTDISISLMSQYRPAYRATLAGGCWGRPLLRKEYERVCEEMMDLGFDRGWMQEFEETQEELIGYHMAPDEGC